MAAHLAHFAPRSPGILMPLAVKIGALSWMPRMLPLIVRTDKLLQAATRGRLTILDIAGLPNMMLTTTGRDVEDAPGRDRQPAPSRDEPELSADDDAPVGQHTGLLE